MKKRFAREERIKTQMIRSFLMVGIIPILVLGIISGISIKISMYRNQVSSLKQISSMVTKNLDQWGDDNLLLAEEIATSPIIRSGNLNDIQSELKNKQAQSTSIYNIMYTDTDGNVLVDSMGSINSNVIGEKDYEGVCKGQYYISDVYLDTEKNKYLMVFSAPVKVDNKITGYIISKVKVEGISEQIGRILFSKNGRIYTFNKDGYVTYDSNLENIMNENIMSNSSQLSEGASKALEGNFNKVSYKYNGEKQTAMYNYIPSLNWGTMTVIPDDDIYSGFSKMMIVILLLIIVIVVLVIIVALKESKKLVGPISDLATLTKQISEGDLTRECKISGTKEIANIGNDFNEMVKSLKSLVLNIQNESNSLREGSILLNEMSISAEENSTEIANAMEEISSGSVQQAEKTDDILESVRELDYKVVDLTKGLDETNKALDLSKEALINGNNGTRELKDSTLTQSKLVKDTVYEVKELSECVADIDKIIEAINDIADQTSLLALNAAIEAARAGDAGKGFVVVAEEVGNLANESQNATKQIEEVLNNIRTKADSTTRLMNSINESMKIQFNTVEETLNIFKDINNAENKIEENINSFSKLIEFVKEFSSELLILIETLASSAEENAAVAEEVTASSESQIISVQNVKKESDSIKNIVDRLQVSIEKFKVE